MDKNKFPILILVVGIIIMVFFASDIVFKKTENKPKFDFSNISRPVLYDESPVFGSRDSKLFIYEYGDFNCEFCAQMNEILYKIAEKYKNEVSLVWKDFMVVSEDSINLAKEARCAGEQGKFWEYHDYLFNKKSAPKLNAQDFDLCLRDDKIQYALERDFEEGLALGVDSTPTIIIGDVALVGVSSFSRIEQAVLEALKGL